MRPTNGFQLFSSSPPSLSALLFPITTLLRLASASSKSCDCYETLSGSTPSTFQHYDFYDFRDITPKKGDDFDKAPPLVTSSQDHGAEPVTAEYFNTETFTHGWVTQSWTQKAGAGAAEAMVNSPQNVYIHRDSPSSPTHLSLRTSRLASFQSVSELSTSLTSILHASIRVRARISGPPGAIAGLFFYANALNETDTEIRTRDPASEFRATNQPGVDANGTVIPGASSVVAIPSPSYGGEQQAANGTRGEWNEFRVDWTQAKSEWIVNGQVMVSKGYGVPTREAHFAMNMWSNGGSWSGNMTVGEVAAMDVEWVEMAYNATTSDDDDDDDEEEKKEAGRCEKICEVDGEAELGSPKRINGAVGKGGRVRWWVWAMLFAVTWCIDL